MKFPLRFFSKGDTHFCKLHRSLYALKHVSNKFSRFSTFLIHWGFWQSIWDNSPFRYIHDQTHIYIFSLVSDIIISRNNIMLLFLSLKISLLNLSPLKFLALLHIFYLLMFLIQNKEFFYVNKNIILIFYLFLVWLVPDHLISIHNSIFIYD